ncbi:MAG: 6-phosphogluconolactonase, partial [Phycisphaerae bacterium]|nr:6-phosphogluconolactonase [Phycisphaerae bacterium]
MPTHKDTRSILVENTAEEATEEAAKLFKTIVCEAVDQRGICHVALAGGTTPHALYESLANSAVTGEVPWSKLVVFFGDERDVPHDHIESNYNMVQRTMLDHLPIAPTRVHSMRADAEDLPAAAAEYERTIRQVLQTAPHEIPKFDLILLGMGGEGHTASLFPDTDILTEEDKFVSAA